MLRKVMGIASVCASFALACSSSGGGGALPATGGGGGGGGGTGGKQHSDPGQSWTILVYMVADNDLEPFALDDLSEMMQVGSAPGFNIVVQADRAAGYTDQGIGNLPNWESTKRLHVESGSLTELADLGEVDMGDPATLADFVTFGITNFPADHVGVVLWNHGASWPGFGVDESAGYDPLNLTEIANGLAQGLNGAGKNQLAFIGFDACLMATVETAFTLRPYAEYLLASEEFEPGHGWDYRSFAGARDNPALLPPEVGKSVISGFKTQAIANQTATGITLSLVDLYALDPLGAAIATLAQTLNGNLNEFAQLVGTERPETLAFGKAPDPAADTNMIDLGDFSSRLAQQNGALGAVRDQMNAALNQAVVARESGPATSTATGLAIYFPRLGQYYKADYDAVSAPEIEPWRAFIKTFYGAAAQLASVPLFLNPDHVADTQFVDTNLFVSGQLDPSTVSSVADAYLLYGINDSSTQSLIILGSNSSGVDTNGLVVGAWDGSLLTLTQGDTTGFGYVDATLNGSIGTLGIPFSYEAFPGATAEYVLLNYVYDADTGATLELTYYVIGENAVGELLPEPGSTLTPLLLVVSGGSSDWAAGSDAPFDAAQPIDLGTTTIQTGAEVYLELDAENIAGQADYVYVAGTW